nr:hypothetical protein [Tanacetum cinerariifolium]
MYDVLRLTPFFKAFLVTADVLEIYMQEFWATATVHHHFVRFKMDNKKHIVNLESFREMLHICPRLSHQPFVEPPFEEEILAFLYFLGHNAVIRKLTDVNISKLHQPWRAFAAIINKCLTGKSSGYDSLQLSQAQILWGLYHKRNVHFAYLMWEDFVYQVEHKDTKKSNEMYYPRFTKVIIHQFMSKNPSIPRRNKPKASVRKTRSCSDTTITPPTTAAGPRLTTSEKGKQAAKASKAKSLSALPEVAMTEAQQLKLVTKRSQQQTHISQVSGSGAYKGTVSIPGVLDVLTDESEEEISWNSTDEEGDDDEGKGSDDDDDGEEGNDDDDDQEIKEDDKTNDEEEGGDNEQASDEEEFIHPSLSTHIEEEARDEESFDPISKTPEDTNDEGNGEENLGLNVGREEGHDEKEEEDELYRDVNINQGRGIQMTQEVEDLHVTLTLVNPDGMKSIFETTSQMDAQTPTSVAPLPMSAPTLTSSTIATITATQQAPLPPTTASSTLLQDLPNFGLLFGFNHRLKTLEANFSKFSQTNQFAGAVSAIPGIAQADNDEFLKTIDENMQKIIKEQVKDQVKVQVSKILPRIKQTVNEQLEAEVLTRSSNSSKTSYAVAADLSEMELKKILIEKMESNKSIHQSNEQRNLYKSLVEAYESDKIILDTYGETVTLKRRRDDDADKEEEPSPGSDRGSAGRSIQGSQSRQTSASESAAIEEPMQTTFEMEEPSHLKFETGADDQPIVESVDTLTPELLAGPTYELMKGSCKSLVELEYQLEEVYKATTYQLDWVNPEGQQYPHNLLKPLLFIPNNRGCRVIPFDHFFNNDLEYLRGGYDKHALWGISHWGRKRQQFYGFAVNRESARDVYSKRRIIAVTELKIVEWHNYKHLDWITVRRDDDKLYKLKEGDFKRLRIQDIEDIIVIQRRVEDLQLGVESYQKKLNLTKPDMYRSDLKRKEAYIAYSNPRGFIYQNKDKKNRLMRIDELHKFSDGTLTDARTALDDRLKGIQMQYLPQSIWRKNDKDRAAGMIQAIDKRLKTKRIMRSLERFVRGRLYEGDFRMLQRTI